MMDCEAYRREPEEHSSHLEQCEVCRQLVDADDEVAGRIGTLHVEPEPAFAHSVATRLPVAPWEGASHRSWKLTLAAFGLVVLLATAAFLAAGISPLRGLAAAITGSLLPGLNPIEIFQSFSAIIATAPGSFHITVGILFVVVNLLLVFLLRRPPRGYDA
jgi:hypothetical protein